MESLSVTSILYLQDLFGIYPYFTDFFYMYILVRRAESDGSMSASVSAGPGFDPWWGSKFSAVVARVLIVF